MKQLWIGRVKQKKKGKNICYLSIYHHINDNSIMQLFLFFFKKKGGKLIKNKTLK